MNDTIEVQVTRPFRARAEQVFDAWLDPAWLGRWMFGPDVRAEKVLHLRTEPRVGGGFSFLVERQGQTIDHVGTYQRIERPRRLVFTWAIRGESDEDASTVAIDIADTPEGCMLTLTHTLPARWADYAPRTRQGWSTMLDALQRLF
ncbi:SRPBCC family protein [Pseudoxanthomonas sp. z9]|uniref:SRPBCC family protein n=1 Tax=Pseudoxanthomonas sp. z9 TaxID=2584942 RepID=UPI0011450C64|nr:SRPBCC family protein [Pseudoxanthomonas sp. z9]MCL6710611.1 SRPBCC domain-containing protein [Pseudomonas sp. R2.Fl]